jgi:hypothetical protein
VFLIFGQIFAIWPQKESAGESNKGIFETNKILHILTNKTLEVARFRQCALVVRQNYADSKKDLLVHQDSPHLLLINAEDPTQCIYLRNLREETLVTTVRKFTKKRNSVWRHRDSQRLRPRCSHSNSLTAGPYPA